MRIAVAGAGITGRCIAWRLAEQGHHVDLFDPRPLDHTEGSSHGRSRIVRQAYPNPFWTRILRDGYRMWRDLELATDQQLVHECGLLYLGPEDHPDLSHGAEGLAECEVPFELLHLPALCERFPTMRWHEGEAAIFTPQAGWVNADRCRAAAMVAALRAGAKHQSQRLEVADNHDVTVWAVGPWAPQLFPELPLRITRQFAVYLQGTHTGPAWIEAASDYPYGFPNEPRLDTVKVALHSPGPVTLPEAEAVVEESIIARTIEAASHRLKHVEPNAVEVVPCLYTNALDDRFFVFWRNPRELVVAACSGHAFKFGPWLGAFVADIISGTQDLADWPQFSA
ncbi:MAG: FAD-dependent oxidoreductase [Fimbriimonadaceae bacterium]|nr:FAD-dependent oxidoreductase [Fimbriimonadaceae bacterium]